MNETHLNWHGGVSEINEFTELDITDWSYTCEILSREQIMVM